MPRIKYSSCCLQSVQLLLFTNPTIADVINQSQVVAWVVQQDCYLLWNITWYRSPGEYYYIRIVVLLHTHVDNKTNQK